MTIAFNDRMKYQADTQKEWVIQQKSEKLQANHEETEEEKAYAEQTMTLNRMRGMLEDEMTDKRNAMMKQIQAENKRLALEKKQREQAWKHDQQRQNELEITDPNYN